MPLDNGEHIIPVQIPALRAHPPFPHVNDAVLEDETLRPPIGIHAPGSRQEFQDDRGKAGAFEVQADGCEALGFRVVGA